MSHDKIALITGANRGLGFETARGLGRAGVTVVIAARKAVAAKEAAQKLSAEGIKMDSITLDVTNRDHHQAAHNYIKEKYGRLDILVNNAGVFLDSPNASVTAGNQTSQTSEDVLRQTFDANFFGVVFLTQKLLPLIRKSIAGRIVNLSSILGSITLHADSNSLLATKKAFAYNASKVALNVFTIHLANELKDTPIKVNSVHPGWVKTDMGGANAVMDINQGSETSIAMALLPEDGPTGGYFHLDKSLPW